MRTIKSWKGILGIVLVAGLVSVLGVQVAAADSRGANADVIFTKWVTTAGPGTFPGDGVTTLLNMEGVVSGDAGAGKFAGEVVRYETTSTPTFKGITRVTALYHINVGGTREFTARLKVVQDDVKGTAVLKGEVTKGWMKNAEVNGSYQVIAPSGILNAVMKDNAAFQGTLHLQRDR